MNGSKERTYMVDPDAMAHDLINDATELLQSARGLSRLLAALIYEADEVDCTDMASALDAIEALTQLGLLCATQAYTRMVWDQTPAVSDVLGR